MKNSDQSNMFMITAEKVLGLYAPFMEGNPLQTFAVVSTSPLSAPARKALESSAEALGYGKGSLTYICMVPAKGETGAEPADLLTMLEGIDPLNFVIADAAAAQAAAQAYRTEVPLDAASRVRGRTVAAFTDLEAMLASEDSKQRMWALLKELRLS